MRTSVLSAKLFSILVIMLIFFSCGQSVDFEDVKQTILSDSVPVCPCPEVSLTKPDIVFFGEMLPQRFHMLSEIDCSKAELLICIGTSLEVYPFAGIADSISYGRPR